MEIAILEAFQSMQTAQLSRVMATFTHLGDLGVFWILLGSTLICDKRSRRTGLIVLMALGLSALVCNVTLKPLIARVRPYDAISTLTLIVEPQNDFSFPSGHASASFAAAMALWQGNPKFGWIAWPTAALIAFSRLYFSLHYPSDVLAGMAIGAACGYLATLLGKKAALDVV